MRWYYILTFLFLFLTTGCTPVPSTPTCQNDEILKYGKCEKKAPTCQSDEELKNGVCTKQVLGSIKGEAILKGLKDHSSIEVSILGTAHKTHVNKDGTYQFKQLPLGRYTVQAVALSSIERGLRFIVNVANDKAVTSPQFTFSPIGKLSGKVIRENASNHAGILVLITNTTLISTTAKDGSYNFDKLPIGSYTLKMVDSGYKSTEIKNIQVKYNDTTIVADQKLEKITGVGNKPPIFTSQPVTTTRANKLYKYEVKVKDPEGKTVILSLSAHPKGMLLDTKTNTITWTPTDNDSGVYTIVISAKDTAKLEAFQIYNLKVEGSWRHYSQKNGLPSNKVGSVTEASDGSMWFATNQGLAKLNQEKITTLKQQFLEEKVTIRQLKPRTGGIITKVNVAGGTFNKIQYLGAKIGTSSPSTNLDKIKAISLSQAEYKSLKPLGGTIEKITHTVKSGIISSVSKVKSYMIKSSMISMKKLSKQPTGDTTRGHYIGNIISWDSLGQTMTDNHAHFTTKVRGLYLANNNYTYYYYRNVITNSTSNSLTLRYNSRSGYFPVNQPYWLINSSSYFYWTLPLTGFTTNDYICLFKTDKSYIRCERIRSVNSSGLTFSTNRLYKNDMLNIWKNATYYVKSKSTNIPVDISIMTSIPSNLTNKIAFIIPLGQNLGHNYTITKSTNNTITVSSRSYDIQHIKPNARIYFTDKNGFISVDITDKNANWTNNQFKNQYLQFAKLRNHRYKISQNTSNTITISVSGNDYSRYYRDYFKITSHFFILPTNSSIANATFKLKNTHFPSKSLNGKYIFCKSSGDGSLIVSHTADTIEAKVDLNYLSCYENDKELLIGTRSYRYSSITPSTMTFQNVSWQTNQWQGYKIYGLSGTITSNDKETLNISLRTNDIVSMMRYWHQGIVKIFQNPSGYAEGTLTTTKSYTTNGLIGRKILVGSHSLTITKNTRNTINFIETQVSSLNYLKSFVGLSFFLDDSQERKFLINIPVTNTSLSSHSLVGYSAWKITSNSTLSSVKIFDNTANQITLEINNSEQALNLPLTFGDSVFFTKSSDYHLATKATFINTQGQFTPSAYKGIKIYTQFGYIIVDDNTRQNIIGSIEIRHLATILANNNKPLSGGSINLPYKIGSKENSGFDITCTLSQKITAHSLKTHFLRFYDDTGKELFSTKVLDNTATTLTIRQTGLSPNFNLSQLKYYFHYNHQEVELELTQLPRTNLLQGLYLHNEYIKYANGKNLILNIGNFTTLLSAIKNKIPLTLSHQLQYNGYEHLQMDKDKTLYVASSFGLYAIKNGKIVRRDNQYTKNATSFIATPSQAIILKNVHTSRYNGNYYDWKLKVSNNLIENQYNGALIAREGRSNYYSIIKNDKNNIYISTSSYFSSGNYRLIPLKFKPMPSLQTTPKLGDPILLNNVLYTVLGYQRGIINVFMKNSFYLGSSEASPIVEKQAFNIPSYIPGSYSSNRTFPFVADTKGGFWISGSSGLYYMISGKYTYYNPLFEVAQFKGVIENLSYKKLYIKQAIWKQNEHKNKKLIIGHCVLPIISNGTNWLETQNSSLISYCNAFVGRKFAIAEEDTTSTLRISALAMGSGDEVWMALGSTLEQKKGAKWTVYTQKNTNPQGLPDKGLTGSTIYSILPTSNAVWIGTSSGIVRYDKNNKTWQQFNQNNTIKNNKTGLISDDIHAILKDKKGLLWFGTNKGLSRYNEANKTWVNFTSNFTNGSYTANGNSSLMDNYINHLYLSSKGEIWVSTPSGVSIFQNN